MGDLGIAPRCAKESFYVLDNNLHFRDGGWECEAPAQNIDFELR